MWADRVLLWDSLMATLATTVEGFALALVGGVGLAVLFNQSRLLEYSLYPYAIILQVTPVVAIAPLLLMDEPFAALDEITRFRLNGDLLALWQSLRKTVIFVTHSVFESVFLSSRIIVMTARPGRVFKELVVAASYPRDERFRTSAEYAGLCRTASEALAAAMAWKGHA